MNRVDQWMRWLPWLGLIALVGGFVSWVRSGGDFDGYVIVGELVLQQRHIYADAPPNINTWPPLFSLLCVPLAALSRPSPYLGRGWWLVLNFCLFWLCLQMISELVYRRPLRWSDRSGLALTPWSVAIGVPCLLVHRFILSNFDHLQVNILIFAMTLGGLYLGARRRPLLGGVCIGTAAALKLWPIVFVPYLLYRRQWKLALASLGAALLLSISPSLLWGWERFVEYLDAWRQAVAAGWGVGKMNQSVLAMFDRLLGHGITPFNATAISHLQQSESLLPYWLTLAVLLVVIVIALATFRGRWDLDDDSGMFEISIVFLVAALFGPVAWKAYLVVLVCPMIVLVRRYRDSETVSLERRVLQITLAIFFVLADVATRGILGKRLGGALEMLSVSTWATLLILAVLLWLRARSAPLPRSAT